MKQINKRFLFVFSAMVLYFNASYAADTSQAKTVELSKINQLIKSLRDTLTTDQNKKTEIDQQLHKTEKNMQQIAARLNAINQDLTKQERALQNLQQRQHHSEQGIKKQQQFLTIQIRKTYELSRQQYGQHIFEQSPADIQRMMVYYRYLSTARIISMQGLNESLQQVLANQQRLNKEKQSLQQSLARHRQQREILQGAQQNRKALLNQINSKIQTHNQRLTQLIADKQALERLIKRLQAQARINQAVFPQGNTAFAKLQGRLPWPTQGRIEKRFGTHIDTSGLRYNGVLLSAPNGQAVQAIYPGKIVFADWLQGFGRLIIIDHGKGFMSLYGRNSQLYKKVGEIVRAGETVAAVGNNSGQEQTGLYFEIRHNGRPSNPETWCRFGSKKT